MDVIQHVLLPAFIAIVASVTLVFLLSKCFFLAPFRVGWLMMFANVFYETLFKKMHWRRVTVDLVLLVVLAACWAVALGPWVALIATTVMAVAWGWTLVIDLRWRGGELARQDSRYAGKVPLPVPQLIVVLRGPVLRRGPIDELGDWPEGHQEQFDVVVLNPSLVVPQLPMTFEVTGSGGVEVTVESGSPLPCPDPGEFVTLGFTVKATGPAGGDVRVRIAHGDLKRDRLLRVRSVVPSSSVKATGAEIRRWKGGARAGFAWRGDQDLFDPCTFQSIDGLKMALGLSSRFHLPSTLFLSGKLSLLEDEHRKFCDHFGWDRRSGQVPEFARWLREEVTLEPEMEFPMQTERPLAMEVGNHMYIHMGTHAAAAEGNAWKTHSWMGDGRYPWQAPGEADSFTEQRDNALKNTQVIEEQIGTRVRSWGVPGRVYDEHTSRAVEAAGLEVGTDTNASAWINVLKLVPPHHPEGCESLVEITKKYPGDPNDAYKIAMLRYWLHAARRRGGTFLFMAHHHLLRYESSACYHLTEEFFRHVLGDCHGDFYVATVTSLGLYWKRVLSPKTRCVAVTVEGNRVNVVNSGDADLDALPVEVELAGGKRFMTLVSVAAGQTTTVEVG